MDSNALYERDFYAWIQYHIELLKQGKLEQLDVDILTISVCPRSSASRISSSRA